MFRPSGGPKKVKHAEFEHMHNGPPPAKEIENRKNFMTRSKYELFQKQMVYMENEFDRKDDLRKDDYLHRRN